MATLIDRTMPEVFVNKKKLRKKNLKRKKLESIGLYDDVSRDQQVLSKWIDLLNIKRERTTAAERKKERKKRKAWNRS